MYNKYQFLFLSVLVVSFAAILITIVIYSNNNAQEINYPIVVKKTQLTSGDEPIPPGLSIFTYKVGNSEPIDFMDSSGKYSIGDTIRGKQK